CSPTNIQPVLDAVAESAARLCESFDSAIFRREGDRLLLAAHHGPIPVARTIPLVRESVNGRAVLDGRTIHIADLEAKAEEFPVGAALTRGEGVHAHLSVPLMREGVAIGTINLRRTETELFTDRQVALLQTFADQAVIAIETVRLFTELQEKNHALTQAHAQVTEALEQQTATSEILKVISSSPTDLTPVLRTIAENARRVCGGYDAHVFLRDGEWLRMAAHQGGSESLPVPGDLRVSPGFVSGRAILERRVVQVRDLSESDEFPDGRELARRLGYRTNVAIPLLREGEAIGVLAIRRTAVAPFADSQIALLQTFA